MPERKYKSIGEVLGLLLEEFPNVTISKIRFLESQGLIEPERTASGYRKFSDSEVDRLKYILREQETNYLPLRVIRDRLDESGAVPRDPTNPVSQLPRSLRESSVTDVSQDLPRVRVLTAVESGNISRVPSSDIDETGDFVIVDPEVVAQSERAHPTSRRPPLRVAEPTVKASIHDAIGPISRESLMEFSGLLASDVDALEQFGLLVSKPVGGESFYEGNAREVATIAKSCLDLGIEIRHLKSWRLAAEKEATLFEQRLMPLLRQRNPAAREQSLEILDALVTNAGNLRQVLVRQAIQQFIDPR